MSDKTLRELQSQLPWTGHYHRDFRSTPMTHKDFGHGLLHVHKAGGKLAGIIDEAEHGGVDWADPNRRAEVEKYIADLVICALRMATTCPEGQLDLQAAVEKRLFEKNNQLATEAATLRKVERMGGVPLDQMAGATIGLCTTGLGAQIKAPKKRVNATTTVHLTKEQAEKLMQGVNPVSVGYAVDPPTKLRLFGPAAFKATWHKDAERMVQVEVDIFDRAWQWFNDQTDETCDVRESAEGWEVFIPSSDQAIGTIKRLA